MGSTWAELNLSIELGSDPIRGSVEVPPEEPQSFRGWIELTEAIEAARNQRPRTSSEAE